VIFFIRADDFACSAFAGQQWQQRLNSMMTIRCDARCCRSHHLTIRGTGHPIICREVLSSGSRAGGRQGTFTSSAGKAAATAKGKATPDSK
jgi:hypothetical protein